MQDKLIDYQKIMKFAHTMRSQHGMSNLYLIKRIDKDGNVVGEYYGMNHFTDYGMEKYCTTNDAFPTKFYIGQAPSTAVLRRDTPSIYSLITETAASVSTNTVDYAYPLYYDDESGYISCICRYMVVYYDYNTLAMNPIITEYGIGTAYNELWTHSWVYDEAGNRTSVQKLENERLTISVYLSMSYNESLVNSCWDHQQHFVLTTMHRFIADRMKDAACYTYKRNNSRTQRAITQTSTAVGSRGEVDIDISVGQHECARISKMNDILVYNTTNAGDGYLDGFMASGSSGYLLIEPQTLETSEPFDVLLWMNFSASVTDYGFSDMFGTNTTVPFTRADITDVKMFDAKTKQWDISMAYQNNASHCYTETSLQPISAVPIYYTNGTSINTLYVYMNLYTNDAITQLTQSGVETIYATDKYWDINSWVLVTNLENISPSLRNKKYWITSSNTVGLTPVRASQTFQTIPSCGQITTVPAWKKYYSGNECMPYAFDHHEHGWCSVSNTLLFPQSGILYTSSLDDSQYRPKIVAFGDYALGVDNNARYLLMYINGTTVTERNVSLQSFDQYFFSRNTYMTNSGTGLVCLQNVRDNCPSVIIDLSKLTSLSDDISTFQTSYNSTIACAIWGTRKVAYILYSDTTQLHIHDYDNNTDTTYSLPNDLQGSAIVSMFGHLDYVWFTNGTNKTYYLTISSGVITECQDTPTTITSKTQLPRFEITHVDDVLLMYYSGYRIGYKTMTDAYYILYQSPNITKRDLSAFELNLDGDSGRQYYLKYIESTKNQSGDITKGILVLIIVCRYSASTRKHIIDFGKYLADGDTTQNYYENTSPGNETNDSSPMIVTYGDYINDIMKLIPISYFVKHKITGSTNTITTLNHIKNISNKYWITWFTNHMADSFDGVPPGTQN